MLVLEKKIIKVTQILTMKRNKRYINYYYIRLGQPGINGCIWSGWLHVPRKVYRKVTVEPKGSIYHKESKR